MWRLFITIVLVVFFGFQLLSLFTFRNFLKRMNPPRRTKKWVNIISITPFVIFVPPYIYLLFGGRFNDLSGWVYDIYIIPFYIFSVAVFIIGVYLLIGKLIKLPFSLTAFILNRFNRTREWFSRFKKKKEVQTFDKSRRRFVTGAAALVSGYAFISSGISVLGKDDYEITYKEIKIDKLPAALKGTTITLVCDMHSGPYMSEGVMKDYSDIMNDLGSDIIVIPGDLTNSNTSEVKPFVNAFRDLKAKHGVYGTLGNHDFFSDPNYIAEAVNNETPIRVLRNESLALEINDEKLCLIGVEDTRHSGAEYDPVVMGYMNDTVSKAQSNIQDYDSLAKILLYHKPYRINDIKDMGFDLVLSGHTHGGQFVLAKFGNLSISPARTASPYISGLFKEGNTQMYVSRGLGVVGLPVRLNCPPEITVITLV